MLKKVLNAKTTGQVNELINLIKKRYNIDWVPIGNNESNHSTFQILSKGENGIIERLTNAIDAVIEKEYYLHPDESIRSPRISGEKYFGIKNGDLSQYTSTEVDDNKKKLVELRVSESEKKGRPTIEIRDKGIGLTAKEFEKTILSLQAGNKLQKFYLAGTFGQGGSTANIFSQHTIYISKVISEKDNSNKVTFTITKDMDDFAYKAPIHLYMIDKDTGYPITIVDDENLFESGTLVKHIEMNVGGYGKSDANAPGSNSMLHFVNNTLFNPILPIKVIEERESVAKTNIERNNNFRTAIGYHSRLNNSDKVVSGGTIVCGYKFGGKFIINYWILDTRDDYKSFNEKNTPVLYTVNGQVQGSETNNIFNKIGKPYLMEHVIVNVDCDGMSDGCKTRLFTSDRIRFQNNDYSYALREKVQEFLSNDDNLNKYNKIFHERMLNSATDDLTNELNKKIENKLKVFLTSGGIGNISERPSKINPSPEPYVSQATEEFPTFLNITNKDPYELEIDKNLSLNYASDADYEKFDMASNL
ncbi:MAG: hypothetical protein PHY08_10740, partial [Candidatus Cloacimonetes bacterium]|nr:hypothetical protein [Candidatus Cloacimonadota bacterium]